MRRLFLVFIVLFVAKTQAQTISNGNLQTWSNPSFLELLVIPYGNGGANSYQEPNSWSSLNVLSRDLSSLLAGYQESGISLYRDASGFSGNGAKIKTIKIIDPLVATAVAGLFGTDTIGILFTGKQDLAAAAGGDFLNALKLGVPYSGRAKKIKFKTKYNPNGADTASVWVLLTKYNSSTLLRDTIGYGSFRTSLLSTTTWNTDSVMIDFNPRICANPDTITIACLSSGNILPKIGSEFFVDEFTTEVTTLSCDATLSTLTVSLGNLNPAFSANTFNYGVGLPAGETVTPTTSYTTTHPSATTTYTVAPNITSTYTPDRTTIVAVTAEDPIYVNTYTVEFHTISNDATLSSLTTFIGSFSPAFSSGVYSYTVTVSYSTTFTPNVFAVTTNQYATYTITNASDISSSNIADRTTTITVTAEDGVTILTYIIVFEKAPAKTNADLFFLAPTTGSLNTTFSASVLTYTVTLNNTPGTNPSVIATVADPSATRVTTPMVSIASATVADRIVSVLVTAEDGVTTKTYSVTFYTPQNPINASVGELKSEINFSVFPNPSAGKTAIIFNDNKTHSIAIYDVLGKKVLTKTATQKTELSIENKGIYYIVVDDKTIEKIVVE